MREAIEREYALSKENNCIEINSARDFYIKDFDNLKCSIVAKEDTYNVEIVNRTRDSLFFFVIDKCIYTEQDGRRCDCAVFNDNSFYFIEIKDNKPRNRKVNRKKAIAQLKNTILDFRNKNLPLANRFLFAFISFRSKNKAPKINRSQTVSFWTKYNVRLMEGSKIIIPQ